MTHAQEFVVAAMRATGVKPKPRDLIQALTALGQPLMNPPSPAGFADDTRTWLAPDAMTNRLDIAESLAVEAGEVDPRQLANEVEKLSLYVGDRAEIGLEDVDAVCSRNKTARAFALGDALGDRDLPRLLRRLDEEFWEMQFDSDKSEIGLLYGLISKVRALLMLKEMLREGWIKPEADYSRFKAQLGRIPADKLPADRRFNPLALNPYVLYKALPQVKHYSETELVEAMARLLQCNQRLVSSGLDERLVLQQALVAIVSRPETAPVPA